jgi:hypothetical protein
MIQEHYRNPVQVDRRVAHPQVHYTPLNVVKFQNCLRETNVTHPPPVDGHLAGRKISKGVKMLDFKKV